MARLRNADCRRPRRPRRGALLVEAAIVLTVLVSVTFGTMEYGWLLLKNSQIENAARSAARLAATPDATNTTVTAAITSAMTDAGMGSTGYTTTFTPTDVSTATSGQTVKVSISVTYSKVAITGSSLVPVPTSLTSTVSMTKEGP